MRTSSLPLAFLFVALSSNAGADPKQVCAEAYSQGQILRDSQRLISAQTQFVMCAREVCAPFMKGVMVKECAQWLSDVERRLPSVVFTAKRGGIEVVDATVTVDGALVASKLDGRAVLLDPGQHSATFEAPDGSKVDVRFTAEEGTKYKNVSVRLPLATAVPAPNEPPAASVTSTPSATERPVTAPDSLASTQETPSTSDSSRTIRVLGYAGIAAGSLGLVVSGIFGLKAMSNKSDANCDADNFCDAGPLDEARNAATVANIGFGVGSVLLAGGFLSLLLAPTRPDTKGANVAAAPILTANSGGLALRGHW